MADADAKLRWQRQCEPDGYFADAFTAAMSELMAGAL